MKKRFSLLFLLLLLCGLAACGKKDSEQKTLKEGEYYLYYTNLSFTKLGTDTVSLEETEAVPLAGALLEKMQETPEDMELLSVFPEEVKIAKTVMGEEGQMFVYFNAGYNSMEPNREILCRAAVVKTLTQIEGVEYVGFYIGDQPLMDTANNTINLMSAASFVENSGSDTEEIQRVQLTLYFTDATGTKLIKTTRTIVCSSSASMESLVVDQLLAGAEGEGVYDTLPETAKALQVSVRKGVCYVNFDSAFVGNALDVSDYIPIYSVVNSLTELSTITKVQISVDGVSSIKFRDSISLEKAFERKMDYVETPAAESTES